MTFQEVLSKMFSQIIQPTKVPPTAKLSVEKESYEKEIGTIVYPTFSVDLNDGKYTVSGQTDVAAKCSLDKSAQVEGLWKTEKDEYTYTITGVKSSDVHKSSGDLDPITASSSTQTKTVTAKVAYKPGSGQPIDNIGGNATIVKIGYGLQKKHQRLLQ